MTRAVRRRRCCCARRVLALALIAIPAGRARVASTQQISIFQDDARLDARSRGNAGPYAPARRAGGAGVGPVVLIIAAGPISKRMPPRFNASRPGGLPGGRTGGCGTTSSPTRTRTGSGSTSISWAAPPLGTRVRVGPPATRTRTGSPPPRAFGVFVRAIGTRYSGKLRPHARQVDARRSERPAPGRLLVDLERARLRPEPGPAGRARPSHDREQPAAVPQPAGRRLELACRRPATTPPPTRSLFGELAPARRELLGRVLGHDPARLPAQPVLRGLELPPAARVRCPRSEAARPPRPARGASGPRTRRCSRPAGLRPPVHALVRAQPRAESRIRSTTLSTRDYTSLGVIGNLSRADRPPPRRVRVEDALPDLRHRVRLHHRAAQAQPRPERQEHEGVSTSSPGNAARVHELGRIPELAQPAASHRSTSTSCTTQLRPTRANDWAGFASGLLTWTGAQKATYYAFRLPLYLPADDGAARPLARGVGVHQARAVRACSTPARRRRAQIQFRPAGSGSYSTVQTVTIGPQAELLLRRARDLPVERQGPARLHLSGR